MSTFNSGNQDHTALAQEDPHIEAAKEWTLIWDELAGPYSRTVSFGTVRAALRSSRWECHVPDEVIMRLLQEADLNKDGVLQKEEFMKIADSTAGSGWLRGALRSAAWCAVPVSERDLDQRYYYEHYKCCPPPLFIPLVSLLQIAVFIYYSVDMGLPTQPMAPCPTYSPLVYDPARRYQVWRYLSYMTVHSGWLHLLTNLLTQLMFGLVLEMVHGPIRLSAIYIGGVVCGALATSVSTPSFFLAGASGGVYAIEYAHLSNLIMNWNEIKYPLPQAVFIAVLSLVDVGYSIYDTFFVLEPSHTGHLAHIGGALSGLLLGICLLRNLRKLPWERYCVIGAATLLSLLVTATILVNVLCSEYYPETDYTSVSLVRHEWMAANHRDYSYFVQD